MNDASIVTQPMHGWTTGFYTPYNTGTMQLPMPTETRPWGAFQNLFKGGDFLVKLIEVAPGHRLSLQRHFQREEYWIVVSGEGFFELEEEKKKIEVGSMVRVGLAQTHRVANQSELPLIILEVQKGECREDDIERLQDDYRRV